MDSSTGLARDQLMAAEETLPAGSLWLASIQPLFTV
jgi:hypothetical protein